MTTLKDFTPQAVNENQKEALAELATLYSMIADVLLRVLPDGTHKSSSLRNLLESKFYASQSITHPGGYTLRSPSSFYVPPSLFGAEEPRRIACAQDIPA